MWIEDLPLDVSSQRVGKSCKGVSHEGYSSALRSGTEESNLCASVLEVVGIVIDCIPRPLCDSLLEVLQVCKAHMEGSINFN